jgi:hypothetical protein
LSISSQSDTPTSWPTRPGRSLISTGFIVAHSLDCWMGSV